MMIKIENEDHSYNAIDTFALWTEVNDFIKEYRINQVKLLKSSLITHFLNYKNFQIYLESFWKYYKK